MAEFWVHSQICVAVALLDLVGLGISGELNMMVKIMLIWK